MNKIEFGIDRFKDKVILCLGDSITSDYSEDNSSWCQMIRESLPIRELINYGVAGTTVSITDMRQDSFLERYQNMRKEADLIVVFGGINDFNHSVPLGELRSEEGRTFRGAINQLCRNLVCTYPHADLMFITPMHAFGFKDYPHWDTQNEAGAKLKDYVDAILDTCAYYSIPVLNLFAESGMTPDIQESKEIFIPDGLHPQKEGRMRMVRKILNFMVYHL